MARKKGADSGATLAAIVAAASRIIAEDGASSLSLRRVAKASDLSLGTVSYYFSSRDQLVQACLEQQQAPLRAALEAARSRVADGEAMESVLGRGVAELYRHRLIDPELLRLRVMVAQEGGERSRHHPGPYLVSELDLAASFVEEEGGLERRAARLVVQTVSATVARYLTLDPSELRLLVGVDDPEEARAAVADHLERLVIGLVRAHRA